MKSGKQFSVKFMGKNGSSRFNWLFVPGFLLNKSESGKIQSGQPKVELSKVGQNKKRLVLSMRRAVPNRPKIKK